MKSLFFVAAAFCFGTAAFSQDSLSKVKDTAKARAEKNDYLSAKKFVFGGTTFAYGLLRPEIRPIRRLDFEIRDYIVKKNARFSSRIDEVTQWAPTASLFALDAFGVETEHSFKQHVALHLVSGVAMTATVYPLKSISNRMRPDTSKRTSFPSGHMANAFRGADILRQELKRNNPVLSYSGYVIAAATGVLRIYNNKHWFSDVVAGVGVGMLSSKFAYWLMEKRHRKRQLSTGF